MDEKDLELYHEEQREYLIELNKSVKTLNNLIQTQIEKYVAPKDNIEVTGKVEVNTEKEVIITNLESVSGWLNQLGDTITNSIKETSYKPLEAVKISNLPEIPEAFEVKNLSDLKQFFVSLENAIKENQPIVNVAKQEIVLPTSANKPIPVRLSDGKSFYNAIAAMSAGGLSKQSQTNLENLQTTLNELIDNQTNQTQYSKILDSWGDNIGATMIDELKVSEKQRLCGGVFNGTTLDTNFYTTALNANGTATISNSVLDLATTVDSGSSALIYTNSLGRYIGGNMNHLRGIVRVGTIGATNNTMRFGVTSTSALADSFYFQVTGTTLSVVAKTTGAADIKVDSGSFNGVSPTYTLTGNYVTIEILFTNKVISFYINGNLIHTLTETTTPICGTRHLRPFAQNINTGVGGVAHLYLQSFTLLTWGITKTQPKYYLQQGTTAGVLLKVGIGSLHLINISGVVNNAIVTIYDNTSAAGTVIYTTGAMTNQTVPLTVPFNDGVIFSNGLYMTITGANCNCQVIYE